MYNVKTDSYRHQGEIRISVITSLYKCKQHLHQYFKFVSQISNLKECEFVFIHNDPSEKEKDIIFNYLAQNKAINYLYIPVPREGLYKSWNRGIINASGKFIAVWNVDDIRFPNSLLVQANALEERLDAGLVYGNKLVANGLDDNNPQLHKPKDISENKWFKPFMDGSLIMWKKSVHDSVGYYDEQFVSAGDKEMWYRIGKKYMIIKINETVGLFYRHKNSLAHMNEGLGEDIIIGIRYGFYQIKSLKKVRKAIQNYSIVLYKYEDKYIDLKHNGWNSVVLLKSIYVITKHIIKKIYKYLINGQDNQSKPANVIDINTIKD